MIIAEVSKYVAICQMFVIIIYTVRDCFFYNCVKSIGYSRAFATIVNSSIEFGTRHIYLLQLGNFNRAKTDL